MPTFPRFALVTALLALPGFAHASDLVPAEKAFVDDVVARWLADPELIAEIRKQNEAHAGLSAAEVVRLDDQWRAELGTATTPTIDAVMSNPASARLRENVDSLQGAVVELIVMDAVGLNVALSALTSDYWQGDEAKHQETYGKGADAMHAGEIEFDESTQTYVRQVSLTIPDPDSGAPIGAITIGLNAEAFH